MSESYLIDTSACNRLFRSPAVERHWAGILDEGRVAVCEITELELVRATGGRDERAVLERYLHDAFGWTPVPDRALTRARQVQISSSPQAGTRDQEQST